LFRTPEGNSRIRYEIAQDEMSAVYIALPVALLLALIGVIAFIWSVRSGQLDDLTTPGVRVLLDDDETAPGRAASSPDQMPIRPDGESESETCP
jgi:cbb3-type cytochrome oxidase maturation protein